GPRPAHTAAVLRTVRPIRPIQVLRPVVAWLVFSLCRPWARLFSGAADSLRSLLSGLFRLRPRRSFRTVNVESARRNCCFVVSDEMRADVLVACSFCGRCLVLEAPKECLGDVLFEVHARILCNH